MGYLVSVDVVPDTREQEQEEYEAELIENGQAVRCTECGALLTAEDRGYEAELCMSCAVVQMKKIIYTIRDLQCVSTSRDLRRDLATALCFLSDNEDKLVKYILDEEDDEK